MTNCPPLAIVTVAVYFLVVSISIGGAGAYVRVPTSAGVAPLTAGLLPGVPPAGVPVVCAAAAVLAVDWAMAVMIRSGVGVPLPIFRVVVATYTITIIN